MIVIFGNTMNNTKTLAIVAVLMAATLVVGTFATMATTTQSAYAYAKKLPRQDDKKTRDNGSGNRNGNTIAALKCQNKGSASGFDTAVDQECENLICTHPGNNATCTQEGLRSTPTSTPTPEPITTTLRVIKKVVCQPTDPNCSLPEICRIDVISPSTGQTQTFQCEDAIGNGVLVTLQPGKFSLVETIGPGFNVGATGDCGAGTIAEGQHLTCTITNTEQEA
jgi:hypothetical protein